jgi:hypothetical protein
MKKNIFIMVLAFVLVVGTGHFAFARHGNHGHGVRHGFYKVKKHKHHRKYHRFQRYAWHHHQPIVVVKERYIPYPEPSSTGGTELDFGNIILRLPELVVFE